jgi:hypothetical protein
MGVIIRGKVERRVGMNLNVPKDYQDRIMTNVDDDVKRDPGFSNFGGRRTYVNPKYGETLSRKKDESDSMSQSISPSTPTPGGGHTRGGGVGRDPSAPRDWNKVLENRQKESSNTNPSRSSLFKPDAKERIISRAIYDIIGVYRTALDVGSEMGFDLTPDALREWLASYASDQIGDLVDKYLDKGGYAIEEMSEAIINKLWDQAVKWSLDRAAGRSGIPRDEIQSAYDNIYQKSIQHYRDKAAAKRASAIRLFGMVQEYISKFINSSNDDQGGN